MKTIEEAAKEYAENLNYTMEAKHNMCPMDFEKSFKRGASFAEEWISIKDELPDYDQPILTKDIYGNYDLMYLKIAGDERVSEPDEDIFINGGMWYKLSENLITHWRPINRK